MPAADNSALMSALSSGSDAGQTMGDIHLHVNAVDAQSVARLFQNNGDAIAKSLAAQIRNLNPAIRSAMSSM